MPYTVSKWRTQISVGPSGMEYDLGLADGWEGAGATSESELYRRATGSVALSGTKTREDGTARFLADERIYSMFKTLDDGVGEFKTRVTRTPIADDLTPFASGAFTMTGNLTGITQPGTNYNASDAAEFELTFSLDGDLA